MTSELAPGNEGKYDTNKNHELIVNFSDLTYYCSKDKALRCKRRKNILKKRGLNFLGITSPRMKYICSCDHKQECMKFHDHCFIRLR